MAYTTLNKMVTVFINNLIIYSVVHVKVTHMVTLTPSWREHSLMVCAILIRNSFAIVSA